jgi:hypothetical protein
MIWSYKKGVNLLMPQQLFNGKEQIFRDVVNLAQACKSAIDLSGFEGGSVKEFYEFQKTIPAQKIQVAEDALNDYMVKLSFDDVKMLQTVMYLGRDRDYDKSQTPIEIFNDYLNYLGKNGWNTKEIEINQMTEKAPLADYIRSGLEILNVTI